jgi:endonuclease/exonuclease/phosphatase family metal-dependent hydrolase
MTNPKRFSVCRVLPLVLLAGGVMSSAAMAQLRVAVWNISNYSGADRGPAITTAVYGSFEGRSMRPDVIALQEIQSQTALNTMVSVLNAAHLSATGQPGDWAGAAYINGTDTDNAFVYRTSKVQLLATTTVAVGTSDTSGQPRNTYRYDIRPVGYTAPANTVAIYNVHLKAGSTTTDNARRLIETTRIRDNAEGVDTNGAGTGKPAAYQFLVGGDMNVQSANQTGYLELIGSQANNAGRVFDPIFCGNTGTTSATGGSWNGNGNYETIHTQDPTGNGGMDDRLDQILLSAGLIDGAGMDYIGNPNVRYSQSTWNDPNHSYRCWGNDGSSFNTSLTTTGNTMVGPLIAQALKDCATTAGGHLPVFLDLKLPARAGVSTTTIAFGDVPQGAPSPTATFVMSHTGDTARFGTGANAFANLTYTVPALSAPFSVPTGNFNDAAGGGGVTHTVTMSTATLGNFTRTLTIPTNSLEEPTRVITITGRVVAANLPPVANAGVDQTVTDSDDTGSETVVLNGSLSSDPDGTIAAYSWKNGAVEIATGVSPSVSLPVGATTLTLTVTDNGGSTATDTVLITVNPFVPTGPICNDLDFNNDGNIDPGDVDAYFSVLGEGPCLGDVGPGCDSLDFNNDGNVEPEDVDAYFSVLGEGPCVDA